MIKVAISRHTRRELCLLGASRNGCKEKAWSRRKSDAFTDRQVDILGCIGEYAAAQALGLEMDLSIHASGDDGCDLISPAGSIAVKYNHRWRGFLMVEERRPEPWSDLISDYIVLIHGDCEPPDDCHCAKQIKAAGDMVVYASGWLSAAQFKQQAQHADWGLGGRFYIPPHKLNPIESFNPRLCTAMRKPSEKS